MEHHVPTVHKLYYEYYSTCRLETRVKSNLEDEMFETKTRPIVQTNPAEKIDLLTQEAFKGFLMFLNSNRCPLWLTNFSKLFHVS